MKRAPDPVDKFVGQNIRIFRKAKNLPQTALGNALGLTFQQIQKYERGSNRMGGSRLYEFATVLRVPISFFFDEMPLSTAAKGKASKAKASRGNSDDIRTKRETLEFVRAYYKIRNPEIRNHIRKTVQALAAKL